jgi:hypothetical protein
MNSLQFLLRIADLLLESDEGTKDWVSVASLRRSWYVLCGILFAILVVLALRSPLTPILASSAPTTLAYRVAILSLLILLECAVVFLAIRYYKYIISKKAPIRFDNILLFYFFSIIVFAGIYVEIYYIAPSSFTYQNPPVPYHATIDSIIPFWTALKMYFDFVLFSAFQTVNGAFYRIQGKALFISVLTYFQSLSTLGLVSLFIASYVNRKSR